MHSLKTRLQQLLRRLAPLTERVIEPSSKIEEEEQRRQARLLAALVLISVVSLWMGVFAGAWILLPSAVLGIPIYLLSRSRYFDYARWLSVPFFTLPSYTLLISLMQDGDYEMYQAFARLAWLVVPLLFFSLLSSVRQTTIVAVVLIGILIVLVTIYPVPDQRILSEILGFLGTAATLIIVATAIRERYGGQIQQNLQYLQTTQAELVQANKRLKLEVAEREQAEREALEALELKSRILANVSHDARTPLSAIMMRTELMKRGSYGALNDRQLDVLDGILFSGRDMLGFIDNLLRASQLDDTEEILPGKQVFVLAEWLDSQLTTFRPLIDQKGLALTVEVADDMPELVYSDPSWLKHILDNLLNNAIKFTDEGDITVRTFRLYSDCWALSVKDTGWGIPAEAQEHIFKPFWQVDGSITRKTSRGVGLGLSIVDNLTRLLGGRIEVESEVAVGSTFTVILPLEREINDVADK